MLTKALPRAANCLEGLILFILPIIPFFMARATGSVMLIPVALLIVLAIKNFRSIPFADYKASLTWFSGLVGLTAMSLLYSPNPTEAFDYYLKTIPPLLLLTVFLLTPKQLPAKRAFQLLFLGVVVALALLAGQLSANMSIITWIDARDPAYWLVEMNRGVVVLILALLACWPLSSSRAIRFLTLGLALIAIMLTESGTAKMALLAGLALWPLSLLIPARWLGHLVFGGIGLLLIAMPLILSQLDVLFKLIAPIWDPGSSYARLEIWQLVNEKILTAPLLGYGFEATRYLSFTITAAQPNLIPELKILHPHNAILQIWVEYGLLGTCFAAAGLWLGWRAFMNSAPEQQLRLLMLTTATFMTAMTGYNMWQPWLFGAILLAFNSASYAESAAEYRH